MVIESLLMEAGPDIYYQDGFRQVLEDHLSYLREHPRTRVLAITPGQGHRFECDLYGLLQQFGLQAHLFWIIARMNGYTDPIDFHGEMSMLRVPDLSVLEQLRSSHESTRRIN